MILLIDNYDSFTYNVYQYLSDFCDAVEVHRNDKISYEEALAKKPDGIVVSPGPGRPEDSSVSLEIMQKIEDFCPVLGICLGHQALGLANGGRIVHAPSIMHGKTSEMSHSGTPLFSGIPSPFTATRYHSLVIDPADFPDARLEVISRTTDADSVIMGVRHRIYKHQYGIQFHPESILTDFGLKIIENFVSICQGA